MTEETKPQEPLQGQVALVTGCGRLRGLGRGIALALAKAGADVAIADIKSDGTRNVYETGQDDLNAGWKGLPSLAAELSEMGARSIQVIGDVADQLDAERMVGETIAGLGQVDILVNNAAAPHGEDRNVVWKIPVEAFDEVMRVDARGVFLMSTPVIRHLLDRNAPGRIVNISSGAGRRGFALRTAYSAAKFAVIGLTQAMAQDLAPHGITVNAICPGAIDTARRTSTEAKVAEGDESYVIPGDPRSFGPLTGRVGTPDDIGRAVVFLAEPSATHITGESLMVNGGLVMY